MCLFSLKCRLIVFSLLRCNICILLYVYTCLYYHNMAFQYGNIRMTKTVQSFMWNVAWFEQVHTDNNKISKFIPFSTGPPVENVYTYVMYIYQAMESCPL